MNIKRKLTKTVMVGTVPVGGGNPLSVQSMTCTDTRDATATLSQIKKLADAGCEIVRCAVPDQEAAVALKSIVSSSEIPVVADIHFDHRLALLSLEAGAGCLRLNPGNIGSEDKIREVVRASADMKVPIRIGVNSGSVEKELLAKYGGATAEAMVESALKHVSILEKLNFEDIKISVKASDLERTLDCYRLISAKTDYPLHLGITEAGTQFSGAVRSAVGLGILLHEGIGDTVRVSLTGDPVQEVRAGFLILQSLGLRECGPLVIACPTCGRLKTENMDEIATAIEKAVSRIKFSLKLAVMGCEVNGPGESKEADLGICMGKGFGILYRKGEMIRNIKAENIVDEFVEEAFKLAEKLKNEKA